jgi:hypothetical protein
LKKLVSNNSLAIKLFISVYMLSRTNAYVQRPLPPLIIDHKQGLGLKFCSFKAQRVLELSNFYSVLQHLVFPRVYTENLVCLSGLCPFCPGGLTRLFTFSLLRLPGFLWRVNLVMPNNGFKNLIFAASCFRVSFLFIIQISLPWHKAALIVMLRCLCCRVSQSGV